MIKKVIFFRIDFICKKNISFGHLIRTLKLINLLDKKKYSFYIVTKNYDLKKIKIPSYIKILILKKDCLVNKNQKVTKLIPNFYFIDLPYNENLPQFIDSYTKVITICDELNNYERSDLVLFSGNKNQSKQIKSTFFEFFSFALNKAIIKFRKKKIIKNERKIKVFVNFGSSDPKQFTFKTLQYFEKLNLYEQADIKILLGPGYSKIEKKKINYYKKKYKIFHDLSNRSLNLLRSRVDLSIISGGGVMIENIFLNLPSLVIPTSNSEKLISSYFKKKRVIIQMNKLDEKIFRKNLSIALNFNHRKNIFKNLKKSNKNFIQPLIYLIKFLKRF
jgi:spore coat polysaccharide biosynthesis predicted glycosyltransferase SpsG